MRFLPLLLAFSAPAWAEAPQGDPSPFAGFLPIVLIIGIFYFLIIRPQNKRMKEHRAMIDAVAKGDKVVTAGGLHGKVIKVEDGGTVKVEIADGVQVTVEQSTLARVQGKNEPAKAEKPKSEAQSSGPKKKAANDNG